MYLGSDKTQSAVSPDEHPKYGVLPSPPAPVTTPTVIPSHHHDNTSPSQTNSHEGLIATSNSDSYLPHLPRYDNRQSFPDSETYYESAGAAHDHSNSQCPSNISHGHDRSLPLPPGYRGDMPHPPHPGDVASSSSYDSSVYLYNSGTLSSYLNTEDSSQNGGIGGKARDHTTPPAPTKMPKDGGGGRWMKFLHFSYAELSEATGGFTEDMVGIGSFGTVFKAFVRGNGPYAVKKLHSVS